ncbi:SDR family NAD(P)-dependent oxidoreductase [Solibacillus isronensis]|uniref:SDR family NAD(P)-dependent oxidoreductase n=1 Tax=Solibacillus isronensis TaxID=412383 RepID=UPI0009A5D2EC|nr:SDR family NAD(P)-dependent oxidoreductase [Solibacillus isronensis]
MRFQQKVVLITGGANGIGAKTASLLAQEGAQLVLLDWNETKLEETAGQLRNADVEVLTFKVDITNKTLVNEAVSKAIAHFKKIDILINCVGILQDNLLPNLKEEEWDAVIDINLKGAFLITQAVAPYMVEQNSGKVVLISSQAALGAKGRVNYAAAKAGIQGMIRTLAIELGPNNINVNGVAPGFIDTEMSAVSESLAKNRGIEDFQKMKQAMISQNPIRRTGKPEDIAYTILFLSSDEASYITGQTIYVTGAP